MREAKNINFVGSTRPLVLVLLCFLCSTMVAQHVRQQNDSPYAYMGDQTKTLMAIDDKELPSCFSVKATLSNGESVTAVFDYKARTISLRDNETGIIIAVDTLSVGSKAFTTTDPMAENAPHISPYAFCAGNPVRYTDPTGMVIEEGSLKEWRALREQIEAERDKIQKAINNLVLKAAAKGWSAEKLSKKIGNRSERVSSLNSSLGLMGALENSTQAYALAHISDVGGLSLDPTTSVISINLEGTYNFVHELTHAGQFEVGDMAFSTEGTVFQDVYDEMAAYKAQFAYSPSSVSSLISVSTANSFETITPSWVQGVLSDGNAIYGPGGENNTGIKSVGINSTINDLIQAYPWIASSFRGLPVGLKAYNLPNLYFKR